MSTTRFSKTSFLMGDNLDGSKRNSPARVVTVSTFEIERDEVNGALWKPVHAWAKKNGYRFANAGANCKGDAFPVVNMNWFDAALWCNARSEHQGLMPCYYSDEALKRVYRKGTKVLCDWKANGWRLPTEAEWECAARSWKPGRRFYWGDSISHEQANYVASPINFEYDVNAKIGYHPAGGRNSPRLTPCGHFGGFMHDMCGNAEEWCWDWYAPYSRAAATDPRGPSKGTYRVRRGGSWTLKADYCRVYARNPARPTARNTGVGLRCARTV